MLLFLENILFLEKFNMKKATKNTLLSIGGVGGISTVITPIVVDEIKKAQIDKELERINKMVK